jgi:hypothetical protein
MTTPDWLRESVLKGLQALLVLRLPGAPANDTTPALANAWIAILSHLPRTWEQERDQPRLSRAFLTIATSAKQWPTPSQFIACIPPIPDQLKLNAPTSTKMPPEIREQLNRLLEKGKAA